MNKQEYLKSIGKVLVGDNGKQEFYSKEQIEEADKKVSKSDVLDTIYSAGEFLELATAFYAPVEDFVKTFASSASKYLELKAEAVKEISDTSLFDWGELPDIDIDMSWLDAGEIVEGIGDVIGAILGIFE